MPTPEVCLHAETIDAKASEWTRTRLHFAPDKLQSEILDTPAPRLLVCCTRQWGKSTVAAAKALHTAAAKSKALVLITSASHNQAKEVLAKIQAFIDAAGIATTKSSEAKITLANGSRILALPQNASTVRCYSAPDMIIVDEAAFVTDHFFEAITPMLAVSNGKLWLLSTAYEQKGFFFETWDKRDPDWKIFIATAEDCPRISKDFLARERLIKGEEAFAREFLCKFSVGQTQFTTIEFIRGMFRDHIKPFRDQNGPY